MLLKGFHKAPSGILINGGVLVKAFALGRSDHADSGDEFNIYLYALSGIVHGFIGLRDVLGILRFYGHDTLFLKKTIETRDGAGIASLHELDPEDHQPSMRIAPAHIGNKLNFLRSVLVWMMEGPPGKLSKRFNRAVIAAFPAVNVLSVSFIPNGSF